MNDAQGLESRGSGKLITERSGNERNWGRMIKLPAYLRAPLRASAASRAALEASAAFGFLIPEAEPIKEVDRKWKTIRE
ncbi:MAG: hypothetical protein ACYDH9_25495 [Limisphaerales bacterium]